MPQCAELRGLRDEALVKVGELQDENAALKTQLAMLESDYNALSSHSNRITALCNQIREIVISDEDKPF